MNTTRRKTSERMQEYKNNTLYNEKEVRVAIVGVEECQQDKCPFVKIESIKVKKKVWRYDKYCNLMPDMKLSESPQRIFPEECPLRTVRGIRPKYMYNILKGIKERNGIK